LLRVFVISEDVFFEVMSLQLSRDFCKYISQTEIQCLKLRMQDCLVQKVSVELALLAPNGEFNSVAQKDSRNVSRRDWISVALAEVFFNSRLCFPVAVAVQLDFLLHVFVISEDVFFEVMSLQLSRDFCKYISQTEIQRLKLRMQDCGN
jgi:hypothetical protein